MNGDELRERIAAQAQQIGRNLHEDLLAPLLDRKVLARQQSRTRTGAEAPALVRRPLTFLLVVVAVALLVISGNIYSFRMHLGLPLGITLAVLQSAALLAALWEPVAAWWVSTVTLLAAALAQSAWSAGLRFPMADLPEGPSYWSPTAVIVQALVVFLLALRVRPRAAVEAVAVSLCVGVVGQFAISSDNNATVGVSALAYGLAVLLGSALRGRRIARTELVAQEEQTAEERARRTLLEERNRIARELHDVVAHHMSVISIQAQVAPHLVENPSDELRENLAGIRQNAVEALAELRRVLGVLRAEDPLAEGVRDAPQPTLARLPELVENVRGAGLEPSVEITGTRRPLAPGVELSAFRIVQEALSNAMRHAPGAAVRVQLGYGAHALTVRIVNAPPVRPPAPSPGTGHGLLGMRERASMLGGELSAAPTPDGGYEVLAVLPLSLSDAVPADLPEDPA